MSTRCTIAVVGPVHIYECTNTVDKDGNLEVCISEIVGSELTYNRDAILGHKGLQELYEELKKYFENRPK